MIIDPSPANIPDSPLNYAAQNVQIDAMRETYQSAQPWPHIVIDQFLKPEVAERAARVFPKMEPAQLGLALTLGARLYRESIHDVPTSIAEILEAFESPEITSFIERITGIPNLQADKERIGCGMHQGARGSRLPIHADHNQHPTRANLYRRVNVLIYLNRAWDSHWNGDLELWDRSAMKCIRTITPVFNRCVILGVDDTAFHGYRVLAQPLHITRNAIAIYYYSEQAAEGQALEAHSTIIPWLPTDTLLGSVRRRIRMSLLWRIRGLLRIAR